VQSRLARCARLHARRPAIGVLRKSARSRGPELAPTTRTRASSVQDGQVLEVCRLFAGQVRQHARLARRRARSAPRRRAREASRGRSSAGSHSALLSSSCRRAARRAQRRVDSLSDPLITRIIMCRIASAVPPGARTHDMIDEGTRKLVHRAEVETALRWPTARTLTRICLQFAVHTLQAAGPPSSCQRWPGSASPVYRR
jgi:hypothetical protein